MKKVFTLFILLATGLFAVEFENPTTPLRFGTQLVFGPSYLPFQFGNACSKDFVNCVKDSTSSYDNFNGIAYYSTIDTNIVVFASVEYSKITLFSIYPFSLSSPMGTSLKDLLRTEFMNLQEWGVFDISKDSASTLIDRIIFEMQGGECKWNGIDDTSYINANIDIFDAISFHHDEYCDTVECCGEPIDGGAAMVDYWWTLLPDEKPTSISMVQIKNRARLSQLEQRKFFIDGIKEALPYKVFDVNGILLKQGIIQNGIVQVPKTPAILDIGHQKILLK
ncbi:MAG: hypothetical protein SPM09_07460 [Fibrobacter sp.]|uniref:hypothetical protein n=1 Tax=Fibrobacter sp. TaxID=35828 RepID=UPI002A91B856|nr:hypothetical protein [Fibrobacter sp.]MDY6264225.1 hypothetical protein [Fibrobacter sp.]